MTAPEKQRYADLSRKYWDSPDSIVEFRHVHILVTKTPRDCMASSSDNIHVIEAGTLAARHSARVDGVTGSCYTCLPCLDRLVQI